MGKVIVIRPLRGNYNSDDAPHFKLTLAYVTEAQLAAVLKVLRA